MLTLLEEVVLLAVDETSGKMKSVREYGTSYALAGAVLFDLELARRIDTDTESIMVLDTTPTGSAPHDRLLAEIATRQDITTVRQWVEEIFRRSDDLEGDALNALIARGILRHEKRKLLWIIDVERFPTVDNKPQQFVKLRLAEAILSDSIPDTRDIMLVSLAEACGLLCHVLSDDELKRRKRRIATICNLEAVSRKVTAAVFSLQQLLHQTMSKVV